MKYYINTVSRDHVQKGVEGSFTQANHGKPHMLRKLNVGDWLVFYSPKKTFAGKESLQAFTAIGKVEDDELYQFAMSPDFAPWRRNVNFVKSRETPIHSLLEKLTFIKDEAHWGYPFRRGVFEISEDDFLTIARAMGVNSRK